MRSLGMGCGVTRDVGVRSLGMGCGVTRDGV